MTETREESIMRRIVGVEEHVASPSLLAELPEAPFLERGYLSREAPFGGASRMEKLGDTESRIEELDAAGLTVQILSYPLAGADLLVSERSVIWAKAVNDDIAQRINEHPNRYAGLAHLPLGEPRAAVDELQRAVLQLGFKGALINGAISDRYLDDSRYDPLLTSAEDLDVPLYLHPAPSPKSVRDGLYAGLPGELGFWLSISGWGWHADTAVHVLRLLLSGAFERHPKLKVVIGHLGEGLQIMLPRFDQQFRRFGGFTGMPSEILRKHVWVSMGGFFVLPSFLAALDAFRADRLMYATDYPYGSLEDGKAFLQQLPVSDTDLEKIEHGNADLLFKLCN